MSERDMIDKIKSVMEERDITISKLARMLPGNAATRRKDLSEILNRRRDPGRKFLEEIASALALEWELVGDRAKRSLSMLLDHVENKNKK